MHITRTMVVLGLLVACSPLLSHADELLQQAAAVDDEWKSLVDALRVLREGPREAQLALFDGARWDDGPFAWLDEPPGDDERLTRRAVAELDSIVRGSRDDWLVDRIARSLHDDGLDVVLPVMKRLARHPAPGVRAHAVPFLGWIGETDRLESMWRGETDPWVRSKLIIALDGEDTRVHHEACRELLDHVEPALAMAALDCVVASSTEDDPPLLLARAMNAPDPLRRFFMTGLAHASSDERVPTEFVETIEKLWPTGVPTWLRPELLDVLVASGSPQALPAAVEASASSSRRLAHAGVRHLHVSDAPEAVEALVARAGDGESAIRVASLGALSRRFLDGPMREAIRSAAAPGEPLEVRLAALGAIDTVSRREERRDLLPWIRSLADDDEHPDMRRKAASVAATLESTTVQFTTGCGMRVWTGPGHRLVLPEGQASVRCLREPGRERASRSSPRLTAGLAAAGEDRFFVSDEVWYAVDPFDCWLPESLFRLVDPSEELPPRATVSTDELDLRIDLTDSAAFRALEADGVVETFDRGELYVGVRVTLDLEDAAALETLRTAHGLADTPLGEIVRATIPEIRERWPEMASWGAWSAVSAASPPAAPAPASPPPSP